VPALHLFDGLKVEVGALEPFGLLETPVSRRGVWILPCHFFDQYLHERRHRTGIGRKCEGGGCGENHKESEHMAMVIQADARGRNTPSRISALLTRVSATFRRTKGAAEPPPGVFWRLAVTNRTARLGRSLSRNRHWPHWKTRCPARRCA